MSKQTKVQIIEAATLDAKGRALIASAVVDSIAGIGDSGSLVTQLCETARSVAKGKPIGEEAIGEILAAANKSDRLKKMNERTRANVISKQRTILACYNAIPEMQEALKTRLGYATHHHVYAMASKVRKGASPKEAVRDVVAREEGKAEKEKANPSARVTAALKSWLKAKGLRADKRAAIYKAAELMGLDVE